MTFGIYIHIPFCSRRCDYCDFATWVGREDLVEEYVDSIIRQFHFQLKHFQIEDNRKVDSIFFGGGTPNLIDDIYVSKILSSIRTKLSLSNETEITVECNPDHVTKNQMKKYFTYGVNRISMGVQSSNQRVLDYLGREHNSGHVKTAREYIDQGGITNVNADLIYGSAVESIKDWKDSLEFVISLDVNHVSAYALGVETGTPLAKSISLSEKSSINEDDMATKYEISEQTLNAHGYSWYEISNWSKPDKHSIHNQSYWRGGDIMALGCAAHGVHKNKRYSTPRNIDKYLQKISKRRLVEDLDSSYLIERNFEGNISQDEELFALKLRTRQGVRWPLGFNSELLDLYLKENLVLIDEENSTIYLDLRGRLMANRVSVDLFEEYSQLTSRVQ